MAPKAPKIKRPTEFLSPKFAEVVQFLAGYYDKLQQDELPSGAATGDSYNFFIDKDGKWTTRPGTKYLGTKSVDIGGCTSSAVLLRRDGVELPLVFYTTKSKYFHPEMDDWQILQTGLTNGLIFGKCVMYKTTDNVNRLVFGNGTDNYFIWSGVTGLVASFTNNSVTLGGAVTLANLGFTATGSFVDNGTSYAYTGISGNTFTGVTPDPTLNGMAAGHGVAQAPVAFSGLPKGNVIVQYNGRVVMSTKPNTDLYGGGSYVGSKLNNPEDFTFGVPRLPSEGYQLIMAAGGGNMTAMVEYEGGVALFKQNAVYKHTVSFDENDFPSQQPLLPADSNASGNVGCVGPKAAFALGNQVFFVSPLKFISTLQRIQQVDTPQTLPYSDKIDSLVKSMIWDGDTNGVGYSELAIVAGKNDDKSTYPDKILMYHNNYACWFAPFVGLGVSSFFPFRGGLYATLATAPDVVQMFTGTTDYATETENGQKINARLKLGRQNFGMKGTRKSSKRLFLTGWMSLAGEVDVTLEIDEAGKTLKGKIKGSDSKYFFIPDVKGAFGTEEFGVDTFGGSFITGGEIPDGVGLFRILFNFVKLSFWNIRPIFETADYFKLLGHGSDARQTTTGFPPQLKSPMA